MATFSARGGGARAVAALRRTRPRAYEEWKALRDWGRLPDWEPLRAGFELRSAREAAGLTQAELAARLGVSQQAVARAEQAGSNPTAALLEAWSRVLGSRVRLEIVPKGPQSEAAGRGKA
ncbi:MAG: helix-turn-helix transcriptional regulator [Thermoanaerobaculia bacterium]